MHYCLRLACLLLYLGVGQVQAQNVGGVLETVTDTINQITEVILPGVSNIRIGAGPAITPEYEGSDEYELVFRPLLSFRYRDLIEFDNTRLQVNVIGSDMVFPSEHFRAGPLLEVDFGRDESDNTALRGLGDIDTGVELGFFASYNPGRIRARIRLQQEVVGGHSGLEIIGDLRLVIYKSEKLTVLGSVSSTWTDDDYMNSFFGISPAQSLASGIQVFNAGAGLKDISLSLGSNYKFSDHWALVAHAGYARLLGDAEDSPLVSTRGSPDQFVSGVFAVYSF